MCGIVGYTGKRNSQQVLMDGLSRLEYRGYDSAGIALVRPSGIDVYKAQGRLSNLAARLENAGAAPGKPLPVSHIGISHTRWATHGEPSDINSHPHSASKLSLVHNGIIENYGKLKEFLVSQGYSFESQTDSEVLAKLVDYHYAKEKSSLPALQAALAQVHGSYALAILFADEPDKIYAARKESPLIIAYGEGENFLASDIPAILPYTRRHSLLDDGEIAVITDVAATVYDEFGKAIDKPILTADFSVEAAEKGHFMLKEIYEQPAAINAAVRPRIVDGLPDLQLEGLTNRYLSNLKRIYIVGCGTAMHAGMVGKSAIERLARIPVEVDIASEFRYRDPIMEENELVVVISQSGETIDTLAALRMAKERGAKTLAIVNAVGSSIARAADWVLYTYAGPEIAVASTKAYMVQLCCLYLFGLRLALANYSLDESVIRQLVDGLLAMPDILTPVLDNYETIQYYASEMMNKDDLFFMGRGIDYALSLEGSLKLKEISYVHSEACAAGELKHGPISLVTPGTPILAIATQDHVFDKTISNVQEVKSRGAKVILFCKDDAQVPDNTADYIYRVPSCEGIYMPMLLVPPLWRQLMPCIKRQNTQRRCGHDHSGKAFSCNSILHCWQIATDRPWLMCAPMNRNYPNAKPGGGGESLNTRQDDPTKMLVCTHDQILFTHIDLCVRKHMGSSACIKYEAVGENLQKYSKNSRTEVLFIDIALRDVDCLAEIKLFRMANPDIILLLLIDNLDQAIAGYEHRVFRCLIKSVLQTELDACMAALMAEIGINREVVELRFADRMHFVYVDEILYAESQLHTVYIHYRSKKKKPSRIHDSLSDVEKMLIPYGFFRIHNSFVINLKYLLDVTYYKATLFSGDELPVGRQIYHELQAEFGKIKESREKS